MAYECPLESDHAQDAPVNYAAWHEWAAKLAKTHRQVRCRGCGLFMVWIPKGRRTKTALADSLNT